MIFDYTTLLSNEQAITASAPSTNTQDLLATGTPARDTARLPTNLGLHCIPFLIQVTQDFAAAGAATLQVILEVDDNVAFTSAKAVYTSQAFTIAQLKAGENLGLFNYVPKGVLDDGVNEQYFRARYVVATGPFTAGKLMVGNVAAVETSALFR